MNFSVIKNLILKAALVATVTGAGAWFFGASITMSVIAALLSIVSYLYCVMKDYEDMQAFLDAIKDSGVFPTEKDTH